MNIRCGRKGLPQARKHTSITDVKSFIILGPELQCMDKLDRTRELCTKMTASKAEILE